MISRTMRRNSRKEPLLPAFSCSNSSPLPQRCCRAAFAHQREDLARRLRSRRPHSALTDCSRIARSSAGDEFDRVCLAQASRLARADLAHQREGRARRLRSRRPHSALTDCSRIARSSAGDESDRVCLAQTSRLARADLAHQREGLARRLRSRRPHSALTDCSRIARSSAGDESDRVCLAQASRLARADLAFRGSWPGYGTQPPAMRAAQARRD